MLESLSEKEKYNVNVSITFIAIFWGILQFHIDNIYYSIFFWISFVILLKPAISFLSKEFELSYRRVTFYLVLFNLLDF